MNRIPVVAYDPRQHRDAFMRFSEKLLGSQKTERRQRVIDTFHERMPGRDREPLRYVCMDGGTVAGTLGYMPADFLVRGELRHVRYTHDLLVDPAYTAHLLGRRVIFETLSRGDFFPGGMWMTDTCYKLHLHCGFEEAPSLTTFTFVLKPRDFMKRRQFSARSGALRVALEAVRGMSMVRAHRVLSRSGASFASPERFDAAHDPAWLELARSYTMTRVRDAAYLN